MSNAQLLYKVDKIGKGHARRLFVCLFFLSSLFSLRKIMNTLESPFRLNEFEGKKKERKCSLFDLVRLVYFFFRDGKASFQFNMVVIIRFFLYRENYRIRLAKPKIIILRW